jgi:glycogen(starch) synthase
VRVVVVSDFFRPFIGGIEVLADQLLPALIEKGHDIQVVTSHGPIPLPDEERMGKLLVRRMPFRKAMEERDPEQMLLLRQRLRHLLQEVDPDVIHLNGICPTHLLLLPLLSNCRAAVLLQLHTRLFEFERGPDSLGVRLMSNADWIVSVSDAALKQARLLLPEIGRHSSVIHNAVPAPAASPSPLPFSPPTFLCLGRLAVQKSFDRALSAVARVATHYPDVRLLIGGDGEERPALEALSNSLGLTDRCEWLGWVRPTDVGTVMNASTAMILPSRWEGLPLVAVEAAWMGRPVVATRVDGVEEIVHHQETGLLVEPDNLDDLATALIYLLERPDEARRMGAAARRWVEREFAWESCVAAYDQLYRLVGERAGARRRAT